MAKHWRAEDRPPPCILKPLTSNPVPLLLQVVKGEVVVDETFGEKFSKLGGLDDETRLVVLDS